MSEKRPLGERIVNGFFAIPAVAQFWARRKSADDSRPNDGIAGIPFTAMQKPLRDCRVALVTTAGVHLIDQPPFDMEDPDGDASFREIPCDVDPGRLTITHNYYNHQDADRDINVVFPLAHLRDLVQRKILGSLADTHYGFMGHVDGARLPDLIQETAPGLADRLRREEIDVAFLTPA